MRGFAPPMAPRTPISQPIDQSTVGPIARTAADLKLALDIIAGPDVQANVGWRLALPPARHAQLKDFRVLVINEHPLVATSRDISKAIDGLGGRLQQEGCSVSHDFSDVPDMKDLARTFSALLMSLMGVDMSDDAYTATAAQAKAKNGRAQEQSMTMSYRDWVQLDRHRLALATKWMDTFSRWDVVLCPAAPCTAFPHDGRPFEKRTLDVDGTKVSYDKLPLWTTLPTPNGLPVTTVPIGADTSGLPIGIQIIGPRFEDYTPLAFAEFLERRLEYSFKAPPS
jgi:amidase